MPERPLPRADDATEPYWEASRRGEFVMQRCEPCGHLRFPPRPMCPHCQSFGCNWVPMSGRGRVYSFVVCHPPLLPAFEQRAPLPIVLVELAEDQDLRVVGNLRDHPVDAIEIGMPVEVCFEEVTPEVTLPQWRPAR